MMRTRMDEDERQEYECLKLEGYSDSQARELARSANNSVNRERLAGPRTGDVRHGHGRPPIISDMTLMDIYEDSRPLTLDTRTDEEREDDWGMADRVEALLDLCTPLQRQVLVDLYGFETGSPMSYAEVGAKHGFDAAWTMKRRHQALARIRRLLERPLLTEEQKRDRLRERKRKQARRARARKKEQNNG